MAEVEKKKWILSIIIGGAAIVVLVFALTLYALCKKKKGSVPI